ncbi:hypothetical protein BDR04DRAFT_1087357 [Suillus decipiens]|nr:hypothetical protein BDR04DRAFT_1087357 [Suillus decipiens]
METAAASVGFALRTCSRAGEATLAAHQRQSRISNTAIHSIHGFCGSELHASEKTPEINKISDLATTNFDDAIDFFFFHIFSKILEPVLIVSQCLFKIF